MDLREEAALDSLGSARTIEEGGKAAQCKKLRVGDELVNINGSALYGSRQEALILIKGSYRILKMVVRRRTVPLIRPHSWHLAKLSEPPSAAAPEAPPAMQLHSVPFSVPWHSGGDNSDLSMQWNQLSRHCSTDRSSSLGSMESLDPPSQGYYESQLSPVDPAIFNNKRDSAYSSFSASSNTSDYTVSLRPDEASSMDNLLHGLGRYAEGRCSHPAGESGDFSEEASIKSRSLSRHSEATNRPSSYGFEEEQRETGTPSGPPQPPTRRDSFRAMRGRPGTADKRCASAPVDILSLPGCQGEDPLKIQGQSERGCPCETQGGVVCKGNRLEQYYMLSSQLEPCRDCSQARDCKEGLPGTHSTVPEGSSPTSSPYLSETSMGIELTVHQVLPSAKKHLAGGHRHSAPEKLLSAQLRLLELSNSRSEGVVSSCSRWSKSPLPPTDKSESPDISEPSQGKWGGSRCSTPGSLAASELEEAQTETDASKPTPLTASPIPHPWGRSISVPGEVASGLSLPSEPTDSTVLPRDFGGLSGAVSVGTLLEETQGAPEAPKPQPKPGSSRQHRSSKSRRRSERFATNLRNEIQRKKAQLQKSTGSSGSLLHGELTVEEEEVEETTPEPEIQSQPPQPSYTSRRYRASSPSAPGALNRLVSSSTPQLHPSAPVTYPKKAQENARDPCQASDPSGSDDQSSAGKARRWRWTPEHKRQLELERRSARTGPTGAQTQPGRGSASTSRFARSDECDILPFADRMKFFEETSRSLSVSNLPGLTSRRQKAEGPRGRQPRPAQLQTPALQPGYRRYSYQGSAQNCSPVETSRQSTSSQEANPHCPPEARRPSVSSQEANLYCPPEARKQNVSSQEINPYCSPEARRPSVSNQEANPYCPSEARRPSVISQEANPYCPPDTRRQKVSSQEANPYCPPEARRSSVSSQEANLHCPPDTRRQNVSSQEENPYCPLEVRRPCVSSREENPYSSPEAMRQTVGSGGQERANVDPERDSSSNRLHRSTVSKTEQRPLADEDSRPPSYSQYPYEHRDTHIPRSAFHLAYPVRESEQTKLNRKFSLTERDYTRCRRDPQPSEGGVQQGCQSRWVEVRMLERLSVCSVEEPPPLQYPQRGRALSESDIRLDTQRLCTRAAVFTAPTLSELEESSSVPRKKGPPRPPPPNWEQFHRRRASHHNLLSLSHQNLLSSTSSPPREAPAPQHQSLHRYESPSHPLCGPDLTRPRSHSLPPREEPQRRLEHSPAFTRRAFRPVAPPLKERDHLLLTHPDPPRAQAPPTPPAEPHTRLADAEADAGQGRPAAVKPGSLTRRSVAEWERNPPNSSQRSLGVPTADSGPHLAALPPQSYFSINYEQQRKELHPMSSRDVEQRSTPVFLAACEETNGPFETDIDELRDGIGEGPIGTETQCFARPVTVLETDIDTLPEVEPPPEGVTRTARCSLVEESGLRSRADLMEELCPHSTEGEVTGETWRGGHSVLELSVDTLERRSRQGSSSTQGQGPFYNNAGAKAQLLNKMKDLPGMTVREDDEELCYKRQLMESLRKKLGVLREAQRGLQDDIRANTQLGEEVEALVLAVCKPNEVDKFRMFIGDLDKVVSLLLSLSGRLLRVESALDCLGNDCPHHERLPLLEKKKLLQGQLGEAQELKEHVDRREQAVCRVLGRCLTPEQLRDYSHFVKMKAALLVEQRQLEDKIRLGEEQLRALRESLGLGGVVPMGLGYSHY
ncbi:hypothetical protein JZ751_018719 [Albula glossodonta]|uniref:Protein Shroom4 n=1 Tax=Albula glossodonta TaxID=121402 RepID=A0A8T2NPV5_9TELE|nr:hypothetical protein JZ751_018719 [Albula glossodonta]